MSVVGIGVATENTTVELVVFLADRWRAAVRCGARGEGNSLSLVQETFRPEASRIESAVPVSPSASSSRSSQASPASMSSFFSA